MTKLGIGSYTFAWAIGVANHPAPQPMSALALLERAAGYGVRVVQIADNLPLHALSADELMQVKQAAEDHQIALEVGTRGIAPDHLRAYLRLAQALGSPILRVVIDRADHHPPPAEVVVTLKPLMADFEAADITLAIENHDRFPVATLVEMLRQLESAHVGICLDTVNSFGALETPERVIEVLGPHVVNLHVKDFSIRRVDHQMGFVVEGTPAGKGALNIPHVLETLWGMGRAFNAILELWTPPTADIVTTVATESAWADESVRYLRTLIEV